MENLDLAESVSDNILLNIPIKVLTAEEEAGQGFVSGNDWQIMTEEEYQAQQAVKKEENSPLLAYKDYLTETNNGLVKNVARKGARRNHCSVFQMPNPVLILPIILNSWLRSCCPAQTTDAAVNKATPGLFAAFPTPQAMSVATESEIASHISRLGLYRNKAKFLKNVPNSY